MGEPIQRLYHRLGFLVAFSAAPMLHHPAEHCEKRGACLVHWQHCSLSSGSAAEAQLHSASPCCYCLIMIWCRLRRLHTVQVKAFTTLAAVLATGAVAAHYYFAVTTFEAQGVFMMLASAVICVVHCSSCSHGACMCVDLELHPHATCLQSASPPSRPTAQQQWCR